MGSKSTIKSQNDVNGVFIFNFIVNFTYSVIFIVNFEHISRLAQREKCRNTCFILEKRKKSKFNRFQIEVYFLPNISPLPQLPTPAPVYNPPPLPANISPSNFYFVQIRAGLINEILQCMYMSCFDLLQLGSLELH